MKRSTSEKGLRKGRRSRLIIAIILLAAVMAPGSAWGQGDVPLLIGIAVGAEGEIARGDFPVFQDAPDCDRFASGRALSGFAAGRILLPRLFMEDLGLSIGLGWSYTSGYFAETPVDPLILLDTARHQPRTIATEYRLNMILRDLRIDLLAHYRFGRLAIGAGGAIGLHYSADFRQTDNIIGSGDDRFRSGALEEPLSGGISFSGRSLIADALFRCSYQLPLRPRLLLAPEITLRAGLLSPVRESAWRSFGGGLGVALFYDPTALPDTVAAPPLIPVAVVAPARDDTVRPETSAAGRDIRASIDLFGVGGGGEHLPTATIRIFDIHRTERAFLPGVIQFSRGSREIPPRYGALPPAEGGRFSIDSLMPFSIAKLIPQTLNLLGRAMREDSIHHLTLVGFADAAEPASMARERAVTVRDYLARVWEIDTSRIAIDPTPAERRTAATIDGTDRRRVVMLSDEGTPLDIPVTSERIDHDLDPPLVALDPHIDADAGVRSWSITLSHQGRIVGRYTNEHPDGDGTASNDWRIDNERDGPLNDPLVAELEVVDSLGGRKAVSNRIPLVLERLSRSADLEIGPDGEESYTFAFFSGFADSGSSGERNRRAIEEIAAVVRPGASVAVGTLTGSSGGAIDEKLENVMMVRLREAFRRRHIENVDLRGHERIRFTTGSRSVDNVPYVSIEQAAPTGKGGRGG